MELSAPVIKTLNSAESKALATFGNTINVVPVSSSKVVDGHIWLIDYFFDKTLENVKINPEIALTFWSNLEGYQIKAQVNYFTEGTIFDSATQWISEVHPNRIVKGVLVLDINAIYDISISQKTL